MFGTIEVRVSSRSRARQPRGPDPAKAVQRSDWVTVGTDNSSPVYSYYDDLSNVPVGTVIRYRAILRARRHSGG